MSTPSPAAVMRAMALAARLRDEIGDGDDRLLADTIEGQTDCLEIIDRLAEVAIADKLLAERAEERIKRLKARSDRARATIQQMLEALGITKLERAMVTASVSDGPKSAHITDAQAIPAAFWRRSIDRTELLRALKKGPVDGAEISNGPPILRLLSR